MLILIPLQAILSFFINVHQVEPKLQGMNLELISFLLLRYENYLIGLREHKHMAYRIFKIW